MKQSLLLFSFISLLALSSCGSSSTSSSTSEKEPSSSTSDTSITSEESSTKESSVDSSSIDTSTSEVTHHFSTEWGYNATHHWHNCMDEECEEISDYAEHDYDEWVIDVPATEESEGHKYRNCKVCPYFEEETIDKVEHVHVYSNPTYEWASDNSKCTATRVCTKDESHIETETVDSVYSVITEASETQDGEGQYVATFTNTAFSKQTKKITIPATGTLSKLTFELLKNNTYLVKAANTSIEGTVVIPATYEGLPVSMVTSQAFYGCNNITSVYVSEGVSQVQNQAFYNCSSLVSVSIPQSIRFFGRNVFDGCTNFSFTIYHNAKYVGNANNPYAVLVSSINDEITDVVINGSTVSIAAYAFYLNEKIASISIPTGVKALCDDCFMGLKLITTATVPDSVEFFGQSVFNSCSKLSSIILSENQTEIGNSAFYGCALLTTVVVPDSVKRIGNSAFNGCTSLQNIYLPDGLEYLGEYAFSGCSNLLMTTYDNCRYIGNKNNDTLVCMRCISSEAADITIYDGCKIIAGGVFRDKTKLTSVHIPNSVQYICDSAFNGSGLTEIEIPESVVYVGNLAFDGCSKLTTANLPMNLTTINASVFRNCTKLNNFVIHKNIKSIGATAFYYCTNLKNFSYEGTKAEFNEIPKGSGWAYLVGEGKIKCADGYVYF